SLAASRRPTWVTRMSPGSRRQRSGSAIMDRTHSTGSRPITRWNPKGLAPVTRRAVSRAYVSKGLIRPPSWIASERRGSRGSGPARSGFGRTRTRRDRTSRLSFMTALPLAVREEGPGGLPPGEIGLQVEHPDHAAGDQGRADVDERQPRRPGDREDRHHRLAFHEGALEEDVAPVVEWVVHRDVMLGDP